MAALGKLVVSLSANIAEFSGAMDKAAYTAKNRMDAMTKAANVAGAAIGASLVAGAGALANELRKFANAADETTKAAQKVGVGVEELQRLSYAADLSGVSSEALQTSMVRLARGAADGNKAFNALGVNVKNADGSLKTTNQLMGEVAGKFATYRDSAEKTALAQELFGKAGADMIPLLNSGSAGLAAMAAEADELGFVFDAKTGKAAEAFNDNLTRMGKVKDGIIAKIAAGMLPMMESLSARMVEAANNTRLWDGVAQTLGITLRTLISTGSIIYGVFDLVGKGLASVAAAAVLASNGEFSNAFDVLKMGGADMADSIRSTVNRTMDVWKDADSKASQIASSATTTGGIAAPIVAAAKASEEARKRIIRDALDIAQNRANLRNKEYADIEKYMADERVADMQAAHKAKVREGELLIEAYTAQAQAKSDLRNKEYAEIERYMAAEREAAMKAEHLAEVQSKWQNGAADAFKEYKDGLSDVASATKDLFGKAFKGAEDALVSFVRNGKLDFASLADSIISDLVRIQLQKSVMPGLSAGMESAGAWMMKLFSAKGTAFNAGGSVHPFANGGIVSSPTLFKFANGTGLMGEAGPEAIMPLKRSPDGKLGVQASGGGANVVVNVIEAPGKGGQQQRRNEGGVNIVDVFVEQVKSAIAGDIRRGSGAVPGALSSTYGLNRVAGAY